MNVIKTKGYVTRLTITPYRVTVKVPEDTTPAYVERTVKFVEYILEQFVAVKQSWRGVIEIDSGHWFCTLKTDSGSNNRKYEVTYG